MPLEVLGGIEKYWGGTFARRRGELWSSSNFEGGPSLFMLMSIRSPVSEKLSLPRQNSCFSPPAFFDLLNESSILKSCTISYLSHFCEFAL